MKEELNELEVIYEYHGYQDNDEEEEIQYYAVRPNKTQIKKEIGALFTFADEISKLTPTQLAQIGLPEKLHNAVLEVMPMGQNGARKRLLKFIAGQLHKIDVTPFTEKFDKMKNKSAHAVREHHIVEKWRDRLLSADSADALTELLDEQPHADRQQLRQLIRNVQKETVIDKSPKSSRLLYRYLKVLFEHDEIEVDEEPEFEDGFQDNEA